MEDEIAVQMRFSVERLAGEFGREVAREIIEQEIQYSLSQLGEARIRIHLPILAERETRSRLRARLGAHEMQ